MGHTKWYPICSRDEDFYVAISKLRDRCSNSGYSKTMIDSILSVAPTLTRNISNNLHRNKETPFDDHVLKWVILSGTPYEKDVPKFTSRMNNILKEYNIKLQVIKSTGPTISQILYNNSNLTQNNIPCNKNNCHICKDGLRGDADYIISTTNGRKFRISPGLSCSDAGIYTVTVPCIQQYTGKTTTSYDMRSKEHIRTAAAVNALINDCHACRNSTNSFKFHFIEFF